jgi:nitrogen fixation/metabolism regulation signal transduction histidine kinase
MTGKAREHEVRIMGLGLAALAVLALLVAIWVAVSIGNQLRAPASGGASVTQSSSGPLGLLERP